VNGHDMSNLIDLPSGGCLYVISFAGKVCIYISKVVNLAEISCIRLKVMFLNWKTAAPKQGCTIVPDV
jgi:hypothetical protein